ncbi:probable sodium/metabolite cotransporter BASS1, chloroplastic [Zingiber officinale]|uniref:probable sodium/metabolite cotransporter BASS1, chloroplastic n=1 Tax=Zingiber officinale TaxID=94328 RepID=UPI001C4BFFB5|nr:probable sodium/metabolite cotransporter BASS1, chloroplastic [Zingiber officinale]
MSLPSLRPLLFHHESSTKLLPLPIPRSNFHRKRDPGALNIRAHSGNPKRAVPRWENALATAASLYPLYVTIGGSVAVVNPSAFSWFVARGPASYTCALAFIMLAMGLTLELRDLFALFRKQPFSILCGCVAQYTIMPSLGATVSIALGLKPSLAVGLILLACCPGGTASNVVTLIARGDMPLSIVMTVCTTLAAVFLTPLLTKLLAGTYVPVDAIKLSLSTLQVVLAPILLGSYLQSAFPTAVKAVIPYAPLAAVLTSSLLASSVFSENIVGIKSSAVGVSNGAVGILFGELGVVVVSVILLHLAGFFLGYLAALISGLGERQRRAIAIQVGMQNSSLGVILATSHFASPLVALPAALSAIIMNIIGSSLGLVWRYLDPTDY